MSARVLHHITGRLSLRPPQAESLARLKQALDAAPEMLAHERDVSSILSTLKAEFPTLDDFERDFPSLCFALATGVGKTRLMCASSTCNPANVRLSARCCIATSSSRCPPKPA